MKNIFFDKIKVIQKDFQSTRHLILQQRQDWRVYKSYLEEELIREIKIMYYILFYFY